MRNNKWLRFSLASLTLVGAGLGAGLVACGDDDNGATPTPDAGNVDSAKPDSTTPPPGDSGTDSTTTPAKKTVAKLQIVNAATDLGPANASGFLRFCYAIQTTPIVVFAPLPPIPDTKLSPSLPFPGVPIGIGGNAEGTGADLSALNITPYLMNAQRLAQRGIVRPDAGTGPSCGDLFSAPDAGGLGPMVEGVDYWKQDTITAGTLLNEKSYILVLTGCAADTTVTPTTKCGDGFTAGPAGRGNLKTTVYEVDRATAVDATKIGTQFIHAAAPAAAGAVGALGGAIPGYALPDGGAYKAFSADGGPVALNAPAATPLKQVEGVDIANDKVFINPNPALAPFANSFPQITQLTYGGAAPDGGAYRNGASFTFVAVGDTAENPDAGGQFNTKFFHFLGLPNDPVPSTFK